MMTEKEIREATERLKQILSSDYFDGLESFWQDKSARGILEKDIETILTLANAYLNVKGFPNEKDVPSPKLWEMAEDIVVGCCEKTYNQALQDCKLAVVKNASSAFDTISLQINKKCLKIVFGNRRD